MKGVVNHMIDKHPKPEHKERIAEWIMNPTRTGASQ
jgi:hypothetical protein